MNKHHYKVIFSRVLNQLVVVSELAKAQGKATSENLEGADETTLNSTALVSLLKPIHFSLMVALGFAYLAPSVAEANADMAIRADKAAPGHQQPTILQTANGLPQVNIQTPSAAGVSRNQYSQFDVAEKGAVLNNARKAAQTQLAGWVQGNPNLARGEAKVILNEVNSSNPSRLKGYVEVAGKKADVVIANPSGIHCEGCGVINADRATMTTGKAQVENGELKGYEVKGGKITVSGKGMDNSQSDYTDIIAEKAQIDGSVWSKKGIKVTTGKNKVDRTNESVVYVGDKNAAETDRTSSPQADNQTDAVQTYAVDVSQLGGMYAEKIHLIDNGSGLGVRNVGHIGASAGNVQIDSQGRVVNAGVISSQDHTQINTQSSIEQKGKIETARGNIQLRARNKIEQTGSTIAGGHIRYDADSVEASTSSVLAAGIEESDKPREVNTVSSRKNLEINTAKNTVAKGKNIASGKMDIQAAKVDMSESQTSGYDIHLTARQENINANKATLAATNELTLNTPKMISTEQANLKADWINVTAQRVENKSGRWASQGSRDFVLNLEKGLNNEQGLVLSGGNMTLHQASQFLNNTQGRLLSGGNLTLHAQSLDNRAGLVVADGAAMLNVAQTINNQKVSDNGSLIQAQNRLTVNTETVNNQQTKAEGQSTPKQGLLSGDVEVNAQTVNNQQGGIYSVSSQVLNVAKQLENTQGELFSTGDISIKGEQANVKNTEGAIQAAEQLSIQTNGLSGDGDIEANHTRIQLTQSFDNQRDLVGRSSLSLTTQGNLTNNAGLLSEGKTTLNARHIENTEVGEIQGKQTVLSALQNVVNRGLIKGSDENVIKAGDTLTNIGTGRIYGGHVALQAGSKIVNTDELQAEGSIKSAVVAAQNHLDIAAPLVENSKTVFTQKWAFNGMGGTLSSEGQIVFGRTLDENNQAQGLGDKLLNNGALIEGRGVVLGMRETLNQNARIDTRLEEVDRQKDLGEHYLLESGGAERINFDQLRWASFSRAGKVVYKNEATKTRPADGKIDGYVLPQPNEEVCANEQAHTGCVARPDALYLNTDPVWNAFNITPPSEAPVLPDLSGLDETLKQEPKELELPRRTWRNRHDYDRLMKEYEAKMVEYRKEVAEYEAKLVEYSAQMKPYFDWAKENEEAFEQLDAAILAHNQKLAGKEFYRFWDIYVNERIFNETKVKETHPGKILSQGDIEFNGNVENNRSQILAAGRVYNPDNPLQKVENVEEMGITQVIDKGTQEWTYSRWRGGFKRYHQRKWDGKHDYENITETPLALNQVRTESYATITPEAEKANLAMETIQLANNANVANGVNQSQAQASVREVRSISADVTLPTSSLYKTNPDANSHVLIETDPAFTNRNQWLSGDYMFKALRSAPQNVLKRLGDGYYEQRLVRDQINQLTGRMFLTGYQDLESQYKALMDNGITFAKTFNLTPGIALSPAQVAQLTSDIVWFEEKTVTLPSGKTVNVVAPRVYALAQPGDLNGQGALISAEVVDLRTNRLTNSGTIAGRNLTLLNTQSLHNEGVIRGDKVGIRTEGNFDNIGGTVEAERALLVDVGGDLNHESTTATTNVDLSNFKRSETTLARKALFHVKGEDGKLHLSANNLNAQGAEIINDGRGDTVIQAKNDVNLTALSVGYDEKLGTGNHYRNEKVEKAVVSSVKGKGYVTITGKNILSEGAELESEAKLLAVAENDLVLNGATESQDLEEFHKTKIGSVAKVTKTSFDKQQSETQRGTQVSGKDVVLAAGHDVKGKGLQAIAENDLLIQTGHNVDIAADTNHFKEIHKKTKKTSGAFTSGGGITFGSKSEKHHLESEGWTQSEARSTLGSMKGNIQIQAGNHANVLGTDMITPRTNRIDIEGASVKVEAGKDIINTSERHEYKQAGLTIAVSSPVVSTAQSMMHSIKRSGEVKNQKLKNLHQMKAAYESAELVGNIASVSDTLSHLGKMEAGDISNPSVKISVSIGASQSKQTSETKMVTHSGSELSGGTVAITSRQGDVDILGSSIHAKRAELDVAKNLNVESVQDTYQNRSENKNSGWSVGVFVGANGNSYGLGIEGSAQVGKGHENSDSITQRNSYLNAEETVIKTGQDANFKGAKVNTNRLDADIKGNLTLESRQDSNHYDSKQEQAGAGFSVAIYGSGSSASANYSQNKAKVNYAQVEEQSGFHVGEGGMNVTVGGNTHLAGAVIESEAEQGKNRFKTTSLTHSDIENRSEVEVKSISAGLSTDMAQNAKNAMAAAASALGNKHETASSQTKSAISANINIDTKTPENLTAFSRDTQNANQKVKAFDLTEIKEQQEAAQVAGELFSKITGDVAKKFKFEDGSKEKIVMHAIAGALAAKVADGNVATGAAAGAASEWLNTYVENYLKEQTQDLNLTLQQKEKLRQAAQQVTALAIGAVAGAATGGSSDSIKQGALASYNAETYNRQLHQNEKERIKLLADGDEEKERRLTIAACALVHCSEQIRRDDPNYAETKMYEDLGNSAEFANERVLLRKQSYMFQDAWGAGAEYPMFNYNKAYQLQDYDDANTQVVTRAGGVAQAAYGAGTAFAGGVSCSGGITCVAGGAAILYGADQATAGLQTAWTGKPTQTMGGGVISDLLGVENATGELIYGIANPRAAAVVGNVAKSETLKIMSGVKEGVYRGNYLYGKSPLGDGYTHLGNGQFRGPNGGVVMATGQYDPISGQMIFGGINKETGLANNRYFIVSNVDGKQIPVSKPAELSGRVNMGDRPTFRDSELYVGKDLGDGYRAQVSFLNGREVPYGTKGSVRPEYVSYDSGVAIEVKNYDIHLNRNGLINNVVEQAQNRNIHLPQGMEQNVVIDVRGQTYSNKDLLDIQRKLELKSNGLIQKNKVRFIE